MTIENLKQIAIKYATTKGSRVPLAPDELCNAVVQYMNSFFGVMTDINTIKVAVTEDSGNIVFTITGNTYDGKPITPIVITVDHNDFVTNQEFEEFKTTTNAAIQKNTESINSLSFRVEDTENDITTIQVQVGQINTRVGNTETDVTNLKNRVDNTETNIAKINSTLNNKLDKNTDVTDYAQIYVKMADGSQSTINTAAATIPYSIPQRTDSGRLYAEKGLESDPSSVSNMRNIADVEAKIPDVSNFATKDEIPDVSGFATKSELSKKLDITGGSINGNLTVGGYINTTFYQSRGAEVIDLDFSTNRFNVGNARYGINISSSNRPTVTIGESISNIALENDIPNVSGFIKNENSNSAKGGFQIIGPTALRLIGIDAVNEYRNLIGSNENVLHIAASKRPDIDIAGTSTEEMAYLSDIPAYTTVDSVSYDSTNGAIVAYDGANEIHIPLLAGENVTIDASEDNKKIVISAAGGGGAGDVTAAGNNIFTGENEFRNYAYDTSYFCFVDTKEDYLTNGYTTTIKNGGFDISYYENGEGKYWTTYADNQIINKDIDMEDEVAIKFPKKGGTFALTSDIIKNPIYFISFYANEPSETCHLIGTMMSKNSYGTGQKTNEEFAVMLADNLYTNSNEGLAAYGKLANKDILCIYSEDGLSIRCLDEENSEGDLPTVMFFVMETEL